MRQLRQLRRVLFGAGVLAVCVAGPTVSADAAVITFTATDLADVVAGVDLWQYEYLVDDIVFEENQGFSIEFDGDLYASLESGSSSPSSWDILILQPDPGLPAAGLYDALALVSGAPLAQPFVLTFAWLGGLGTMPAAQLFTINQFDAAGAFLGVIGEGQTSSMTPVPEPSTLLLFGTGAAMAVRHRWRNGHRAARVSENLARSLRHATPHAGGRHDVKRSRPRAIVLESGLPLA